MFLARKRGMNRWYISPLILRNLAPLILAGQSFYALLVTCTGRKQTPQRYWISPRCSLSISPFCFLCKRYLPAKKKKLDKTKKPTFWLFFSQIAPKFTRFVFKKKKKRKRKRLDMYFWLNRPLSLLITTRLFVTPFDDRFQYAYHKKQFPLMWQWLFLTNSFFCNYT